VIPATPAEQRRLLDLQRIDTASRQLQHRRANLPEQKALEENADTLQRIAVDYADRREELERIERDNKRLEDEIATVEARRRSEEGRMYSGLITSQKELEALRAELQSLRGRKNDLEDQLLEVMERREELESMVATLKERHEELTANVAALTEARDHAATDIDAELTGRQVERDGIAAALDEEILGAYDDLRARKEGLGVAELRNRTCLGCHLQLTQIELEEAREAMERGLARCAQCGRILVSP
jgi:uncharacterized protein